MVDIGFQNQKKIEILIDIKWAVITINENLIMRKLQGVCDVVQHGFPELLWSNYMKPAIWNVANKTILFYMMGLANLSKDDGFLKLYDVDKFFILKSF